MTQREKLIELLKSPHKAEQLRQMGVDIGAYQDDCIEAMIADFLLANGVIVPPCKVGQTVYVISTKHPCYACFARAEFCHRDCRFDDKTKPAVKKATVFAISFFGRCDEIHVEIEGGENLHKYSSTYYFMDYGKTVFLTREEAEKALAERIGK